MKKETSEFIVCLHMDSFKILLCVQMKDSTFSTVLHKVQLIHQHYCAHITIVI